MTTIENRNLKLKSIIKKAIVTANYKYIKIKYTKGKHILYF